jgi:AcrR family transcriptional regulator
MKRDGASNSIDHPWPTLAMIEVPEPPESRRDWGNESWGDRYRRQHLELLAVAWALVNELGYEGAQISDIVSRARVSKRAFYEHFDSKADCFASIIRQGRMRIMRAMVRAADSHLARQAPDPHELLEEMMSAWLQHLRTAPRLFSTLRGAREQVWVTEQTVGIDEIAEVFSVAALRLGCAAPIEEVKSISRFFTWGAYGLMNPSTIFDPALDDDMRSMVRAMIKGFDLTSRNVL